MTGLAPCKEMFDPTKSHVVPSILLILLAMYSNSCSDGVMNVGGPEALSGIDVDTSTDTFGTVPIDTSTIYDDTDTNTDTDTEGCLNDGVRYAYQCWYLGEIGENCIQVCADKGGANNATSTVTGTPSEGGTWWSCRNIFRKMGYSNDVGAAYRPIGENQGLGCHIWNETFWWLVTPDVNLNAVNAAAARVCACNE